MRNSVYRKASSNMPMNRIPGFTADQTLYDVRGHYVTGLTAISFSETQAAVTPQLGIDVFGGMSPQRRECDLRCLAVYRGCTDGCAPGDLNCRDKCSDQESDCYSECSNNYPVKFTIEVPANASNLQVKI